MYGKRHIIFHQAVSVFLLALLLGFHVLKAYHTHPQPVSGTVISEGSDHPYFTKATHSDCAICHFDCIRDADIPDTVIDIQPFLVFSFFKSELNAFFYSASPTYFFYRGPPIV